MAPELRIRNEGLISRVNKKFQEWVLVMGKMFPHPVGVFCPLAWVPCGHIAQIFLGLGFRV